MQSLLRFGCCLLTFWFVNAARGQLISFSVKNESLEKVFLLVEQQSGYNFIYSAEILSDTRPISLEVKQKELSEVLVACFKDQPLQYSISAKHIMVSRKPEARNVTRELRGRIVNEKGEPVDGATVTVKRSAQSVVTNIEGYFSITYGEQDKVIHVTGAEIETREINIGSAEFILITVIEKLSTLDETIVIGYGKTTRRLNTGNVGKLTEKQIREQTVSNPLTALAGQVTGLQITQSSGTPGSYVAVQLRGRNSLANGNDPLYIVDGVPYPSATLTSGYGGGAGVISSPLNNFNPYDIESIEVLKDAEATAIYGSRGANGVILISTKKGSQGQTKVSLNSFTGVGRLARKMDLMNTPEYLEMRREAFRNDGTNPTMSNARDLLRWDTTRYTDWQSELVGETSTINDVHLNLSGGSAQTQFLIGGGYHKETTVFPGSFGDKKATGHFSLTHRSPDKRFRLQWQSSYTYVKNSLPQTDLGVLITLAPNAPALYDAAGNLNWEGSSWTNPLSNLAKTYETNNENLVANLNTGYKVFPFLELALNAGFNTVDLRETITTPRASYDPALQPTAFVYAGFGNNRLRSAILEPQMIFQKSWKDAELNFTTGGSFQTTRQQTLLQTGTGYTSDDLLSSLKGASTVIVDNVDDNKYRYAAIFGRFTYAYQNKYLLSAALRRDGSSRFGAANRFSTFGSLGAGWIFSKENGWIKRFKALSFGKLRMSYGTTGNDQIGDNKYFDSYVSGAYPYQNIPALYPLQLGNDQYGWELVKKWETGLELGFLKDRAILNLSYFRNKTGNQLVNYALPDITGFSGVLQNIPAVIRNSGWEIELSATPVKSANWSWTSRFNMTFPKNKLVEFPGLGASSYANSYVVGQSLFIAKRYQYLAVNPADGRYQFEDVDKDGRISSPVDQQSIVFAGQQFFGGWYNTISWKKWSLSCLLQFVKQKAAPGYVSRFGRPGTLANQPRWVLERWQNPGDVTNVQRFSNSNGLSNAAFNNYRQSDQAFSDASFIRGKSLHLSYRFKSLVTAYIQAQNFFTVSKYKGFDPETKMSLPPLQSISLGMQLNL